LQGLCPVIADRL